jgi:hypothetical protein
MLSIILYMASGGAILWGLTILVLKWIRHVRRHSVMSDDDESLDDDAGRHWSCKGAPYEGQE